VWRSDAKSQLLHRGRTKPPWFADSTALTLLRRLLVSALALFIAYCYAMSMTARTGAPFWLPDSVLLCALLGSIHATAEIAEAAEADGSLPSEEIRTIKEISLRASGIVRQLMIYAGSGNGSSCRARQRRADPAGSDEPRPEYIRRAGRASVITVRTSRVTAAERSAAGSACAATESDYVNLEVSDTGPGISREAQAKIFDPFFTTKSSGRGLGLAVLGELYELTRLKSNGRAIRVKAQPSGSCGQPRIQCRIDLTEASLPGSQCRRARRASLSLWCRTKRCSVTAL
jgi:hypothetical protein